jgi:hypothetical protein
MILCVKNLHILPRHLPQENSSGDHKWRGFLFANMNPEVDYYTNAQAWSASATVTISDLFDAIRSDEFAPRILSIRQHLADKLKLEAENLKRALPCVSLSGYVTGKRKNAATEGRVTHSGLLQIDLDAKDNIGWTVAEMRQIIMDDPHSVGVFTSPSGNGVKGIIRIKPDASCHKESFLAAEEYFAKQSLTIDQSCKDPIRLCFVSYDPNAWLRDGEAQEMQPLVVNEQSMILHDSSIEITLDDLKEMISVIPRQDYLIWLEICSAAWNHFGEDATAILANHWPEDRPGEYSEKFRNRLQQFTIGTLWHHASNNGWKPSRTLKKAASEQRENKLTAVIAMPIDPVADPAKRRTFSADDIFYDTASGKYLVKNVNHYTVYGKKSPVVTGLTRHMASQFSKPSDLRDAVKEIILNRELDGSVEWYGAMAGHKRGLMYDHDGRQILITSEALIPQPVTGQTSLIDDIIIQAFPDPQALIVFISWLATRYIAVRSHEHVPAPMLVVAGEVNSGKSLLAWIVAQMLGGRTANPHAAWSGGTLWNDNIAGSELLLVDDCVGSTDIRARRNFGAAFKEAMYPHMIEMRKRNVSAISCRPVWSVMVCCNDTPEAMQIIPPIDNDLSDKIIILHCAPVVMPMDTSTPEGRKHLQNSLKAEMPFFANELVSWQIPDDLKDSRSGIKAWRDPELSESLDVHSPANRLMDLMVNANWMDLPREFSALEVESRLLGPDSPVRDQARQLFTWSGACGSALAKLAKQPNSGVTLSGVDNKKKVNRYWIKLGE